MSMLDPILNDTELEVAILLEQQYQRLVGTLQLARSVMDSHAVRNLPSHHLTLETIEPLIIMMLRTHSVVEQRVINNPELYQIVVDLRNHANGKMLDTSVIAKELERIVSYGE